MLLTLKRLYFKESYTVGRLEIDGVFFCDTLEDKYRDLSVEGKVYGHTAISAGLYRLVMSWSNRFQRIMPELLYVPQFSGIRIHAGNTDADTHGCILVGRNTVIGGLTESRNYAGKLNEILLAANEKIHIEIS